MIFAIMNLVLFFAPYTSITPICIISLLKFLSSTIERCVRIVKIVYIWCVLSDRARMVYVHVSFSTIWCVMRHFDSSLLQLRIMVPIRCRRCGTPSLIRL